MRSDDEGSEVTDRDERLARTFVEAADTLGTPFDLPRFLSGLTRSCVDLFEAVEAAVMVDAGSGSTVVASSCHEGERLSQLEVEHDHGPAVDSYRTGAPVGCDDLGAAYERWPAFAPEAHAAGFSSAHALPMRMHDEVIGALSLLARPQRVLDRPDLTTAQAVADVATIGILQQRAMVAAQMLAGQLQHALDSRVTIEQAKGVLSERTGLDAEDAFAALRRFARNHNLRLGDVARGVVERTLATDAITPVPGV